MNIKQINKYFFQGIIDALDATGVGEIIELLMRVFISCHPVESGQECNNYITRSNVASAVTLSWADYFIQWMPLLIPCKSSRVPSIWKDAGDIIKMWNFYLQAALALDTEINGQDHQTDDRWETPLIFISMFIWAAVTNPNLREYIRKRRYPDTEKGYIAKFLDTATGFCRGFAYGRSLINTVEVIGDAYAQSMFAFSRLGRTLRYTWGTVWGAVVGGAHLKFSSQVSTADVLPEESFPSLRKWIERSNSLFTVSTFAVMLTASIKKLDSKDKIGFSIGLSMLAPAIIIRSCYKGYISSEEEEDLFIPPLDEDNDDQPIPVYQVEGSHQLSSSVNLSESRNYLFNNNRSSLLVPLLSTVKNAEKRFIL